MNDDNKLEIIAENVELFKALLKFRQHRTSMNAIEVADILLAGMAQLTDAELETLIHAAELYKAISMLAEAFDAR